MNTLVKIWIALIAMLSCVAIFGLFEPDPLRAFAPKGTVVYVSWVMNDTRFARAYLADGAIVSLIGNGEVVVEKIGTISDVHHDPYPAPTPFERLRMRFSSSYGVIVRGKRNEFIIGSRKFGTTLLIGNKTEVSGIKISHLPSSLFLWSTPGEPVAAMKESDREPQALGEGRYGRPESPAVAIETRVPQAENFLKLITAFEAPSKSWFPLGDGTSAREIVADTDGIELRTMPGILGFASEAISNDVVPAMIHTSIENDAGAKVLIFSDNSALDEISSLFIADCPIKTLQSFVRAPLFAIGTSEVGEFVLCAE